tara:strand:- start:306 stop:905 length:600 start_codon:yes stop_codon:yes gene_type:complete
MQRIALTGGIGTGKTYVVRLFRRRGIPTLDADQVARAVVDISQPCYRLLRDRFEDRYFLPGGQIDRPALARLVFDDASARADLESIVHPEVRRLIDNWFTRCIDHGRHNLAIAEIPLLFETNRIQAFDGVLVVSCSPAEQLHRVMKRDGLPAEDARKRLAAQLPIADKISAATWVITTDSTKEPTALQVERFSKNFQNL